MSNAIIQYIKQDVVKNRISELLANRANQFTTSLITAINEDSKLAACEENSVLTAALTAASLDLPINRSLGFAYLIPYETKVLVEEREGQNKKKIWVKKTLCQFQMGYKGFIQLAQRTGRYKTINATDVREGEVKGRNRLSGEYEFEWIEDDAERDGAKIVGYVAYFRLLSGFEKMEFWPIEKIEKHAKRYSKAYAKWGTGPWRDDFDAMAKKTVLKLLINKYGPINTQLNEAIQKDQTVDGDYADNLKRKEPLDEDQQTAVDNEAEVLAEQLAIEAGEAQGGENE